MSRRNWSVVFTLLAVVSLLLAACTQPTAEPETETTTEEEVATAVPETEGEAEEEEEMGGGTLNYAHGREPDTLDPHVSYSRHGWLVFYQMFDTLLVADKDMNFHPGLATDWEVSDDGKTFTFYLQEGVTFHDGTPFNAEAVKYNLDRIVDPDIPSMMLADLLGSYTETEIVDDYTVKVHFEEPHGPFVIFAATKSWMVSPTAAEEQGPEDFGLNPVGTGPFKFVEWVPQQHLVLERNPDYNWAAEAIHNHNGPAHFEQLRFNFLTEDTTRMAALETGEADVASGIAEYDVERFRDMEGFTVHQEMVPGLPTTFILNTNKPPLNDTRVRRALNLWLDRELINDTTYAGVKGPAYGPLSPNTFGYWPKVEELNALDRDRALELLAEAGWEDTDGDGLLDDGDGNTLKLEIYSCGTYSDPPEAIEAQFAEMGADTSISMVPWEEQKRTCYVGDQHMMVATFNNPDAQVLRLLFHSDNVGELGWSWSHLHEADPELQAELDALLDLGDSTVETEPRRQAYQDAQKIIVENGVALPMTVDYYLFGVADHVDGWSVTATRWPLFYNMSLNK